MYSKDEIPEWVGTNRFRNNIQGSRVRSSTQALTEGVGHCAKGNSKTQKLPSEFSGNCPDLEDTEFCRLPSLWAIHQHHQNVRMRKKGREKTQKNSVFLFAASQRTPRVAGPLNTHHIVPGMFVLESGESQPLPWCLAVGIPSDALYLKLWQGIRTCRSKNWSWLQGQFVPLQPARAFFSQQKQARNSQGNK